MSLNNLPEADRAVLAGIFASRVSMAKMTEDEAAAQARAEHKKTLTWIKSESVAMRSFRWFCDLFDMDHTAVRRAIAEKRK